MASTKAVLVVASVLVLAAQLASGPSSVSGPTAVTEPSVHATLAGDHGSTPAAGNVIAGVAALKPDVHFSVGDLTYADGVPESQWCDFVKQRVGEGFPFELVAGNHEDSSTTNGTGGQINNISACLPNQVPGAVGTYGREYYVDQPVASPLVRFIGISASLVFEDGSWTYASGTPHLTWLARAIDDARARSIPWIVVMNHIPCLTPSGTACGINPDLVALLMAKKVDLVVSGHDHFYARTHQLALSGACPVLVSGAATSTACIRDSDNAYTAGNGTVFAVVGNGGVALEDVIQTDPEAPYFAAMSGANLNAAYGLINLTATASVLQTSFVRTDGADFQDAMSITRGAVPIALTDDTGSTPFQTPLTVAAPGVLANDIGQNLAVTSWSTASHGSVTMTSNGAYTYTPATGYSGADAFTYTVTDASGASASATVRLQVVPPVTVLGRDSFTRSVTGSWGTADLGGPWTPTASNLSVDGQRGVISLPAGQNRQVFLSGLTARDVDVSASVRLDGVPGGSGAYTSLVARRVASLVEYRGTVRVQANGTVSALIYRMNAPSAEAVIGTEMVVPGVTAAPGSSLSVRLRATGANPTSVRLTVWQTGSPEPAPQVQATDSTAALQTAGLTGVTVSLSSKSTVTPVRFSFDDLLVAPSP